MPAVSLLPLAEVPLSVCAQVAWRAAMLVVDDLPPSAPETCYALFDGEATQQSDPSYAETN